MTHGKTAPSQDVAVFFNVNQTVQPSFFLLYIYTKIWYSVSCNRRGGYMICQALVNHGFLFNFFLGLWDGATFFASLLFAMFWDVQAYNPCMDSWFYKLGLGIGVCILGFLIFASFWWVFVAILVIALIIKVLLLLLVPIMWGMGIGLGLLLIVGIATAVTVHRKKPAT